MMVDVIIIVIVIIITISIIIIALYIIISIVLNDITFYDSQEMESILFLQTYWNQFLREK